MTVAKKESYHGKVRPINIDKKHTINQSMVDKFQKKLLILQEMS